VIVNREVVTVKTFDPRWYQRDLINALEYEGKKKFVIVWPRRCLSGDTHILLSDGSWKFLRDIGVGDKILSWDGIRFVPDVVKNKWSTGIKEAKVLRSFGYLPIVTSGDHRFASLTQGMDKLSWVSASKLAPKRQVLNYAGYPLGDRHDPDLAEFIGYMITDGYCSGYQQPKFTNVNKEILDRVAYLSYKLFGYDPIWRKKGNGYDLGFSNGTRGGGYTKNKVKELFREYGQDVAKSKRRILSMVWGFDEESLGRFFAGVISGDGCIYLHKKGFVGDRSRDVPPATEISINCGLSCDMAWDFYWLFRKIGIVPQVPKLDKGSNWKIRVCKGYGIKWLLSHGPIYGKTEKQGAALVRLPFKPHAPAVWNGCYRCKQTVIDGESEELYDIETERHHNFVANGYVVHNSGKDVAALNLLLRQAFKRVGVYYYLYPKYDQCRRAVWDSILITGEKFLDFIPKRLIAKKNNVEMKITLINGSIIQFNGADNADSLRGTNPVGVIFSEYSRINHPDAYNGVIAPILAANGGFVVFISTPNGHNEFYVVYKHSTSGKDEEWYSKILTCLLYTSPSPRD